ncbi:MAG: M20/M25/M40 family metallo-hydrolase [Candidatus Margulisiibacteriota bacterium]|jgi:tripeptide aminopeptidase
MINQQRLVKTFKQLVKIDSLSLQEAVIMRHLKKELAALGYRSTFVGRPDKGEVGSLSVLIPAYKSKGPRLMLNAHVDTVVPGKGIKPLEKGGYITSDGTTILGADNKAGVAVILELLRVLKEKKLPHPPLQVLFTVAEEIGLVGAAALPRAALKADYALVLDGGDIEKIVHFAPNQYNIVARVYGQAAHAGIHPEEGISAIKAASAAIVKMKLGRIDYETTANIGIIRGGRATNIIPDEVEIRGEARSHKLAKVKKQIAQMEKALMTECRKHGAVCKIKFARIYEAFNVSEESPLMEAAVDGMKAAGVRPEITGTGGGSDANVFNAWGIPSIIMGVGADNVHTTKERIAVRDLVRGATVILNVIKEFNYE